MNEACSGDSSPIISFGSLDEEPERSDSPAFRSVHAEQVLSDRACGPVALQPEPAARRTRRLSHPPLEFWRHEQRPAAPLAEPARTPMSSFQLSALGALELSPISPRSNTWSPTRSPLIDSPAQPAELRGLVGPHQLVSINRLLPDHLLFPPASRRRAREAPKPAPFATAADCAGRDRTSQRPPGQTGLSAEGCADSTEPFCASAEKENLRPCGIQSAKKKRSLASAHLLSLLSLRT